jgi:glyoxylase-like metal-dependent hydrolase (beta-lactamase superfamily II)
MELVRGVYQIKIPLSGVVPVADDTKPLKIGKEKLVDVIEQKVLKPRSVSHVNVYLIEGAKENMLIDTGWDTPDAFTTLNKELRSYGFTFKDISQIVITHVHPDHYGLSGKLKQLCGCKIALSDIEMEMIETRYVHTAELLKQMRWFLLANGVPKNGILQLSEASMPVRKLVVPTTPDVILKEGKKISLDPFEFKVFVTPGHSPGHICLYEPNRKLLFSGDHILPEITPNISLHPQSGENPLGDYLNSLEQIMKLDVTMAFPGHGPAFSGIRQIIDGIRRHHDQRSKAILKSLQDTMKTAYQVATEIPWQADIKPGSFQNLSIFDQRLAIMETLAHIEFLRKEGKVQLFQQEDTNLYFAGG